MTGNYKVTVPARMLLDLLAGRITESQFRYLAGQKTDKDNLFANWLSKGMTLSGVEMAARQIDQDDDHLILTFSEDPAARTLRLAEGARKD